METSHVRNKKSFVHPPKDRKKEITDTEETSSPEATANNSLEKFKRIASKTTKMVHMTKKPRRVPTVSSSLSEEYHKPGKIWDRELANLELSKKIKSGALLIESLESKQSHTDSQRHVHYQPRKPSTTEIWVRKKQEAEIVPNLRTVPVMRPASDISQQTESSVSWVSMFVPRDPPVFRCDSSGEIIPHSILGDVEDFKSEARRRGQYQDVLLSRPVSPVDIPPPVKNQEVPCRRDTTRYYGSQALRVWETEMLLRRKQQQYIAAKVKREQHDLVMVKTDQYAEICQAKRLLQYARDKRASGEKFWLMPDRAGCGQLCETKNKRDCGILTTPTLSGDADCIRGIKSSGWEDFQASSQWFKSEYQQTVNKNLGGVINILNRQLFEDLAVVGEKMPNRESAGATSWVKGQEPVTVCKPSGDADHVVIPSQTDPVKNDTKKVGPALTVNGQLLSWYGSPGCHGDTVAVDMKVLLEGETGVMVTQHITIENIGATIMRYDWKKQPSPSHFKIDRHQRNPFYLFNNPGTLLQGDAVKVPVVFLSRIPGYFTECWVLDTVPRLCGGGKVRIRFRGIGHERDIYSQEIAGIEEMLKKRQAETMGQLMARELMRESIGKIHYITTQLKEDCIVPTEEDIFKQHNPKMFYHITVIKDLRCLYNTAVQQVEQRELTSTLLGNITPLPDEDPLVLDRLREVFLSLSDADHYEEHLADHDEEKELIHKKPAFISQLYEYVGILSFSPMFPWQQDSCLQYIIIKGMLQQGIDSVVAEATHLFKTLNLTASTKESLAELKKQASLSSTGKSKYAKHKKTDRIESITFSAAQKYRETVNRRKKERKNLQLYDEKVYIMMYKMLQDIVDQMVVMFD